MSTLIYLASPYSHADKEVMRQREEDINKIGAILINKGHLLYGPISMSAALVRSGVTGSGWDTWKTLDLEMINRCNEVWVADMPGWQESVGVTAEIEHAISTRKPVYILDANKVLHEDIIETRNLYSQRGYVEVENGS